jgi:hypothetical protein
MPLPANVTTVTVLGTFLTPEGDPSTGTITFTPSSWLTNSGANVAIPNSPTTKTLGTAGNFSVLLPITDDADLSPSGWVYNVSEVVDGVSQNYNILLPGTVAVGGTVFLADLVPAAPAGPEYYSLASSLTIGTVTTVATGGSATATITGLAPSQVLSLGLPTGATGTVASAGSGSVGTAAVAPTGDPNTGIYFPAADQVAITTGGTQALLLAAGAVSNPTFTGVAQFPDGSASAPSITNTGDTNTGILFPAADTVGIATAGTQRVTIDSLGRVIAGATINTDVYGIQSVTTDGATFSAQRFSADSGGPFLRLLKSRGALQVNSVVSSGDSLGLIDFRAADGTGYIRAAAIEAQVDEAPGTNDMPGRLMFYTTADGAASATERMRIDRNGLITGTGTSLGAWTSWTPTIGGTGWALGSATVAAAYCQIGKVVHVRCRVVFAADSTFGASDLPTLSLPVTPNSAQNNGNFKLSGSAFDASLTAFYDISARFSSGVVAFRTNASPEASITATVPFTWTTSDQLAFSGTYEAA